MKKKKTMTIKLLLVLQWNTTSTVEAHIIR